MGLCEAVPRERDKSDGSLCLSKPNLSAYFLTFSTPISLDNLTDTKFLLCKSPSLSRVGP